MIIYWDTGLVLHSWIVDFADQRHLLTGIDSVDKLELGHVKILELESMECYRYI